MGKNTGDNTGQIEAVSDTQISKKRKFEGQSSNVSFSILEQAINNVPNFIADHPVPSVISPEPEIKVSPRESVPYWTEEKQRSYDEFKANLSEFKEYLQSQTHENNTKNDVAASSETQSKLFLQELKSLRERIRVLLAEKIKLQLANEESEEEIKRLQIKLDSLNEEFAPFFHATPQHVTKEKLDNYESSVGSVSPWSSAVSPFGKGFYPRKSDQEIKNLLKKELGLEDNDPRLMRIVQGLKEYSSSILDMNADLLAEAEVKEPEVENFDFKQSQSDEMAALQEQLRNQQEAFKLLQKNLQKAQEYFDQTRTSFQEKIAEQEKTNIELYQENCESGTSIDRLNQTIEDLQKEQKARDIALKESAQAVHTQISLNNQVTKELEKLKQTKEEESQRFLQKEKELTDKLALTEGHNDDLQEENKSLLSKINRLNENLSLNQAQLAGVQDENNKNLSQLQNVYNQRITDLKDELSKKDDNIKSLQQQNKNKIQELESNIQTQQQRVAELTQEIESKEKENATLNKARDEQLENNKDLQQEINNLVNQLSEKNDELKNITQKNTVLEAANAALREEIKELQAARFSNISHVDIAPTTPFTSQKIRTPLTLSSTNYSNFLKQIKRDVFDNNHLDENLENEIKILFGLEKIQRFEGLMHDWQKAGEGEEKAGEGEEKEQHASKNTIYQLLQDYHSFQNNDPLLQQKVQIFYNILERTIEQDLKKAAMGYFSAAKTPVSNLSYDFELEATPIVSNEQTQEQEAEKEADRKRYSDLEKELKEKNDALKKERKLHAASCRKFKKELEDSEKNSARLKSLLNDERGGNQDKKLRIEQLEDALRQEKLQSKNVLDRANVNVAQEKQKRTSIEKELQDLRSEIDLLRAQKATFVSNETVLREQIGALTSENVRLDQRAKQFQEEAKKAREEARAKKEKVIIEKPIYIEKEPKVHIIEKVVQSFEPHYQTAALQLFGDIDDPKNQKSTAIKINYYRHHRQRIHHGDENKKHTQVDLSHASDEEIMIQIKKDDEMAIKNNMKKLMALLVDQGINQKVMEQIPAALMMTAIAFGAPEDLKDYKEHHPAANLRKSFCNHLEEGSKEAQIRNKAFQNIVDVMDKYGALFGVERDEEKEKPKNVKEKRIVPGVSPRIEKKQDAIYNKITRFQEHMRRA